MAFGKKAWALVACGIMPVLFLGGAILFESASAALLFLPVPAIIILELLLFFVWPRRLAPVSGVIAASSFVLAALIFGSKISGFADLLGLANPIGNPSAVSMGGVLTMSGLIPLMALTITIGVRGASFQYETLDILRDLHRRCPWPGKKEV